MIPFHEAAFLFAAALVGGALNSVAGGGGFICFPALLVTGIPPIDANATNTVALWPGTLASAFSYRKEMQGTARHLVPLLIVASVGAFAGAKILLHTPQATFLRMVPWLLLAATLLFTFSAPISRWFRSLGHSAQGGSSRRALGLAAMVQLVIAVYIGFFGAGAGILMLALFAILGVENIHTMNGMKSVLAAVCNGIALTTFIIARAVVWPQALVMIGGAIIGGYAGAHYAQKMDQRIVRGFVIFVGFTMAGYFFWKV
ncbi:MAG: sulfite exporter TauE/SafE family protein [Acidobacteriaceae bacterium]